MATDYINSSATDIAEQRAKYRLAFRDTFSLTDALLEGVTVTLYDSDLAAKAKALFSNLASSAVAYPASQPLVGAEGTVFVIDIRLKSDIAPLSLGAVMRVVADYVPGCELIRVAPISPLEGSTDAIAAREAFFNAAAKVDQQLDETSGITGTINNAAGAARAFSLATLAIIGVGVWLYIRNKRG